MKLTLPLDKQLHLVAGYAITLTFGIIFSVGIGVAIGVVAGIGKEVYDKFFGGNPEKRDVFFTIVGSILAGGVLKVII